MLADVRDFAKAERELVERDAVWTSTDPPVEGHELLEASVTLLIKAVTQMKFQKIATLLQKDLLFTLYNMGIYLAPAVTNKINAIYVFF